MLDFEYRYLLRCYFYTWSFRFHWIIRYTQVACPTMGNLFSRHKDPVITTEDEQFFDCLNDDEPHDEHDQPNTQPARSHYYAVWVPSNVETTGDEQSTIDSFHMVLFFWSLLETQFVFDDMKSAFSLCKKYGKQNSRVKIFANRADANKFIEQRRQSTVNQDDVSIPVEPVIKPPNNDAEKLPYSDVPTSELTKLYNVVEKGDEAEFERLIWSNPRYLISSGDSPTIVKVWFNCTRSL